MKRKIITIMILLSVAMVIICHASEKKSSDNLMKDLYILNEGVRYLHDYYFEEIPSQKMVYDILTNYMDSLDPYTTFIEQEASKQMKMQLKGKYGGVGIVIGLREGRLCVISPFEDTPADRAGLKPEDWINKVDGEPTKDVDLDVIADKIRGPIGTKVTLTIERKDEEKTFDVVLTREEIKLKTVKSTMIDPDDKKVAYIRISSFNGDTANEVREEVIRLKKDRPSAMILDLRNNPGGLLSEAVEISDFFLEPGKMVVYTKGRIESVSEEYHSKEKPLINDIAMIVLINQGSASGSEIVAGALRDNERAILLGMKSYGKGSVQNIFTLSDGATMKITISKYFTPSGVCIDGKGIVPDIEVPLKIPEDLMEKFQQETGEGAEAAADDDDSDSSEVKEHKEDRESREEAQEEEEEKVIDLEKDYQLKKALEFLKVYKILSQN